MNTLNCDAKISKYNMYKYDFLHTGKMKIKDGFLSNSISLNMDWTSSPLQLL